MRRAPLFKEQRIGVIGSVSDACSTTTLLRYNDFGSFVDAGPVLTTLAMDKRRYIGMKREVARSTKIG
jgi:hypothetical protein